MNKLLSCRYNMDTNRVEARFEDETTLAIDCIAIEDEYGNTPAQRAELDWLLYNKPLEYAKLPSDWSAPHLWAWADDGTNAFDAWPGGEMEADSNNDGWYYCWIPENTNNIIINANEAAVQTGDYKLENKNAWVTVTDAENVEISYDAQTTGDLPEYVEKFKIHAQVPDDWQDVCLWAWSAPDGKNAFDASAK